MKPLVVLVLVVIALGGLFFVISNLDGGSAAGTLEPGPPQAAEPRSTPLSPTGPLPNAGDREHVAAEERPATTPREGIQGEGFENRLMGRVENRSGEAVVDAEVTLTRAGGLTMMFVNTEQDRSGDRRTKTRQDGSFSFENVEPYAHYSLEVAHPSYSRAAVSEVNVGIKGSFEEPPIVLSGGATLAGMIRDVNGAGIPGATVQIDTMFFPTQGEPTPDRQVATSDNLGSYKIENISPGHRALRVEAEGFGNAIVNGLSFQGDEQVERNVTLEVAEMICGIVVGPGNAPIPGAEVVALSFSNSNQQCQQLTLTGDDGRFCLDRLSAGSYTIAVRAAGYKAGRGDRVETGNTNVLVEMQPQAILRGKVLDGTSGQPVTSFTVALRQTFEGHEETSKLDTQKQVRHPAGEFELADIQPGSYLVEAEAPGFAPTFSDPFRVDQGQLVAGIVVRLTKGGTISGTVVDGAGNPLPRALVETFNNDWTGSEFDRALGEMLPGNATRRQARADGQGNFLVEMLKDEVYQLRINAHGHCEFVRTNVVVKGGQDTALGTLEMILGGNVSGIVIDQAGKPVPGATVTIRVGGRTGEAARFYQGKTNGEGRYSFPNVYPGSYKIAAAPPAGRISTDDFLTELTSSRSSEQGLSVSEGQSYTIELKLGG